MQYVILLLIIRFELENPLNRKTFRPQSRFALFLTQPTFMPQLLIALELPDAHICEETNSNF